VATCKTCGCCDKKLPENWVNWECYLCFTESFTTVASPLNILVMEKELADITAKRDSLNALTIDRQLDLALRKAKVDRRR